MSKYRPYANLRFCPKCGVEALERDSYRNEHHNKNDKVEYHCTICGFGMCITPSARVKTAETLLAQARKSRQGATFTVNVTPEARKAFEENCPEPWKFKLWRAWRRIQGVEQDTNTYAHNRENGI